MLEREIKVKGIYKHFKGKYYIVEDIALDGESDKEYVIYRALHDDNKLFVRTFESFLSKVDKEKYPTVEEEYRFTQVDI